MNTATFEKIELAEEVFESKPNESLKTIAEIIQYRAKNEPSKEAFTYLLDGDEDVMQWSYLDLKNAVAHVSDAIQPFINKGDRIILLFEPGLQFIAAYLATISSGAIAVPCHPPMGSVQVKRLVDMIADCQPSVILHSHLISNLVPRLQKMNEGEKSFDSEMISIEIPAKPEEKEWKPADLQLDELAMLQYTSGSTGDPKGVMVTQDNIVKNCEAIYKWLGEYPQRKGAIWLPPYHDMGLLGGIMQPLYAGFPLVFMSPMHFVQRPLRWLKAISDYRLTTTGAPNFAFQLCIDDITDEELEEANLDLSCVREIFCGSEPINPKTIAAFTERYKKYGLSQGATNPCYGLAETTLFVTGKSQGTNINIQYFSPNELDQGKALNVVPSEQSRAIVSCGVTGHGLDVQIVDVDKRAQMPDGQVGEIWVAGGSVTKGYWNKEEVTAISFNNYLPSLDGLYYRTGDLGFIHKGELYVTGRSKEVVIIRGRNLYPQDLERCALGISPIFEKSIAAAFSVPGEETEQLVVVIASKGDIKKQEREQLKAQISSAIAKEFNVTPDHIHIGPRKAIPRTTSGKIQRTACRKLFMGGDLVSFRDE